MKGKIEGVIKTDVKFKKTHSMLKYLQNLVSVRQYKGKRLHKNPHKTQTNNFSFPLETSSNTELSL